MTSQERKERRYQRRKAVRLAAKQSKCKEADSYESVFSYANLYQAYKCSRRNVSWKASVQRYTSEAPLKIFKTQRLLMNEQYRTPGFYEFDICERGKCRHIRSTVIGERVVQRCLCDNCLVPILGRTFIYDNGHL